MDPYQVLGVRPDADTGQIRAAYRGRARHVHPDAGGDDDAFARLQAAYRRALDLRSAQRAGPPPPPTGASPRFGPARPGTAGRPRGMSTRRREIEDAVARLWARHQRSVVAMLATQVVALSAVVLTGPPSSPGAAVTAALLGGVGAGYAVYVAAEADRWLSWRRRPPGRARRREPWWRATGPGRR